MQYKDQMHASFNPEYAQHLGYHDARTAEVGKRDFNAANLLQTKDDNANRTRAYFEGVRDGNAVNAVEGLDMRCLVRWDNPGFDTPVCGGKCSHIGFAYGHVIPLCERHARKGTTDLAMVKEKVWTIIPKGWL